MRSITYTSPGGPSVLHLEDRPVPVPGPGEVRVRVRTSGVNPTDIALRAGQLTGDRLPFATIVPHHDGAGVVDAVGEEVSGLAVGDRVWTWLASLGEATGTAQELTCLPAEKVVPLPAAADDDTGACLGVPALTAVRLLTVHEDGPARLTANSLVGRTVLVAGGAGAVGHAAIQLARWAGATVLATVGSQPKADLATAAGAHHVVRHTDPDAGDTIRRLVPEGVDVVTEVALSPNVVLDLTVLAPRGVIATYAFATGDHVRVPITRAMRANARFQFVGGDALPPALIRQAADDLAAPLADGALAVGEAAGLPITRFPLEATGDAQAAVAAGVVGKVIVDV